MAAAAEFSYGAPYWSNARGGYVIDLSPIYWNTDSTIHHGDCADGKYSYGCESIAAHSWAVAAMLNGYFGSSSGQLGGQANNPWQGCWDCCFDSVPDGGRSRQVPAQTYPAQYGGFSAGRLYTIRSQVYIPSIESSNGVEYFVDNTCVTGASPVIGIAPGRTNIGPLAGQMDMTFMMPTLGTCGAANVSKNGDYISWTQAAVNPGAYAVTKTSGVSGITIAAASRPYSRVAPIYKGPDGVIHEMPSSEAGGLEPCTTYWVGYRVYSNAVNSAILKQFSGRYYKGGFAVDSWSYIAQYYDTLNKSIKTDCATPPEFGAYSASATGQTTGRFSWALTSPGAYSTYHSLKVYLKREIESDDSYRLIQTWGADTYGSGTLSDLVPGERYTVKFVARNSWGTRGFGMETTVYRTFRTRYPVGTYEGPYSNGEPGDTRWDYENVSTFDTSRWNMVVQMPKNSDNARLAKVRGTIVGTNDVSGRRDSISWSLFNRSTAEMTSTILNDLGLSSIPLTGSGTLYAPTGNSLVIDKNTQVTSSVVLPGGNNGTNTGYIMNHRLWVKKSTESWSSVKATNYSYRTNGNNTSVTWDLSQENYLPNTVYNLRAVVTNNVGMYTVTEATLYPPAYGGQHIITPIPTGTPDEPRVEITSCVTNTGGLDDFDSADIKYHVFEGRAQNVSEWTQFGRGGEEELCYKVETALPKLECNQNYIIRVTVYNKHGQSVRTEYVLTPPKDITISASTHNEIGIGYFKTNAVSSGSARIAKRETFWRKETDTEWLVAEIDYTVTTADVETRTPRVLEHETAYRGFVRMTNEYGLCANSTQVVWTTMPRYRLWDNVFRKGTLRAKQRPRVRNSAGTVLDSQNVYWIAANALSCQRLGFPIKDCKLRFPKGWHSGTQYECWRVTFEDGRYIAFENSTKGFNNYAYSSYGYYEKDGTLIAEFYNERDKWLMDEYVLPEECYVASFTAQYASGAQRGVRQSSILNRTEVIGSWL